MITRLLLLIAILTAATAALALSSSFGNVVPSIADATTQQIVGSTGTAGPYTTTQVLVSGAPDNSTTSPLVAMTTSVDAGTYAFTYDVLYQVGTITTTGIGLSVAYSGASDVYALVWYQPETGTSITTGVGDGVTSTLAGQLLTAKAERVPGAVSSTTEGVDLIDATVIARVHGVIRTTSPGDLTLTYRSETAAVPVRVMPATNLILTRLQ